MVASYLVLTIAPNPFWESTKPTTQKLQLPFHFTNSSPPGKLAVEGDLTFCFTKSRDAECAAVLPSIEQFCHLILCLSRTLIV
jgi:hypothetical protein